MAAKIFDKQISAKVRRAVDDYNMISNGDRIAVGVSGGKDSLTLLIVLAKLQKYYPVRFDIEAITVDMGVEGFDTESIRNLCDEIGVRYTVENTHIDRIVFNIRKEKNPCSLCANLRRGAVHGVADRLGCNKTAFAHHKDDVIETMVLSLFYEGRIHTFSPVTYLENRGLYLIRPLIYVEEGEIIEFINKSKITPVPSPCKFIGKSRRGFIKQLISEMSCDDNKIRGNIFGAIKRSGIDGW